MADMTPREAAAASPPGEARGQGEDDPSLRQAADLMYRHVALGEVVDADNWRRAARVLVAHANDTLRGSTDNEQTSPVDNVDRETLAWRQVGRDDVVTLPDGRVRYTRTLVRVAPADVALAAVGNVARETLVEAFYTYLMTGSRTTAAVQAVMRDEAEQMAAVALDALPPTMPNG